MRKRRHVLLRMMAAILAVLAAMTEHAAAASLEREIKATFLYKFAPFVEWPTGSFDQPGTPFVLCIGGDDPFSGLVEQAAAGQHIGDHPIAVRHLPTVDAASACNILFAAGSPQQSASAMIGAVRGRAILTVTDAAPTGNAGIVNFVLVGDRVSFDIDTGAAAQNHLTVSSKLLALARNVTGRK